MKKKVFIKNINNLSFAKLKWFWVWCHFGFGISYAYVDNLSQDGSCPTGNSRSNDHCRFADLRSWLLSTLKWGIALQELGWVFLLFFCLCIIKIILPMTVLVVVCQFVRQNCWMQVVASGSYEIYAVFQSKRRESRKRKNGKQWSKKLYIYLICYFLIMHFYSSLHLHTATGGWHSDFFSWSYLRRLCTFAVPWSQAYPWSLQSPPILWIWPTKKSRSGHHPIQAFTLK